jgi:hypothetical protein
MVAERFPLADTISVVFQRKEIPPMNPPVGFTDSVSVASEFYKYHRFHPELVEQLVSIYRIMFPHNGIPDEFYEHVVRKLDDKAAQDQNLPSFLSEGVEALNGRTGSAWTGLSEEARLEALKRAEQTPFFKRLRSDFVLYFYSNPAIWSRFGYEGPSNDQGGYLLVASTTSIGSKERSFNLCHERLIWMTVAWF